LKQQNDFQGVTAAIAGRPEAAALPVRFRGANENAALRASVDVRLDSERVVLARRLGSLAMHVTLPVSSYRGIVIRIVPGMSEAEDRVSVVLAHWDRDLDITLFDAADDTDVIAEWRLWGSALNLPLLMEGLDGHVVAAENRLGDVIVDRPRPRRRHSFLAARRTRFASRRRMGRVADAGLFQNELSIAD
jgi:hypothetical protein